jgi:alpha-mannosidase
MLDVLFIVEGETARTFDLAIGLDLEEPMQSAMDFVTPAHVVPVPKGPPHVGASGWLFYLDAVNLVLTSLQPARDDRHAVIARLVECRGVATQAAFHCPRQPTKAALVDELDNVLEDLPVQGDAVSLYFAATEMKRVRLEFS